MQEMAGFSFLYKAEERGLQHHSNKYLEGGPLYLAGELDIFFSTALWWRYDLARVEDARSARLFRWEHLAFPQHVERKEPDGRGNVDGAMGPSTSLAEEEILRCLKQVACLTITALNCTKQIQSSPHFCACNAGRAQFAGSSEDCCLHQPLRGRLHDKTPLRNRCHNCCA